MKTKTFFISAGLLALLFIAGYFMGKRHSVQTIPPRLSLEQILSIRELHLVKHTYHDLFFLHKRNDPAKAIRSIVHVPVEVTAYINLKDVRIIRQGDSVKQLILPSARLHEPHYLVDQMTLRETRSFQLYMGKDMYAQIGTYLQQAIVQRMDTVRSLAIAHRILLQAEIEAKAYVESLLKSIGRPDIVVLVESAALLSPAVPKDTLQHPVVIPPSLKASVEVIPFGFIPIR